jgi:hypothetical protein
MKGNGSETTKPHGELLASLTWGYLGLAYPLSGCGGRI